MKKQIPGLFALFPQLIAKDTCLLYANVLLKGKFLPNALRVTSGIETNLIITMTSEQLKKAGCLTVATSGTALCKDHFCAVDPDAADRGPGILPNTGKYPQNLVKTHNSVLTRQYLYTTKAIFIF